MATATKLNYSGTADTSGDTITTRKMSVKAVRVYNDGSVNLTVYVAGVHDADDSTDAAVIASGKNEVFKTEFGKITSVVIKAASSTCAYRMNTIVVGSGQ